MIDSFNKLTVKRILDVGIWDGLILKNISLECDKFGLDISSNQTEMLNKSGIKLSVIDFENDIIPYNDSNFDAILLNEVVEHVINTDNLMNEVNRVMRMDGELIISFSNVNYLIEFYTTII